MLGAVLLAARPHLSRPARRLTVWLVAFAAVSCVILEATTPSGAIAGLLIAAIGAAVVHLIFGSCEGNPSLSEVAAALAQLGVDARSLGAADRQQAGLFLVKAEDADGQPLVVKVYGRDAHDTQLLATLWRTVWYREPGSPIWVGRRQQVANEGFVTLLAAQAGRENRDGRDRGGDHARRRAARAQAHGHPVGRLRRPQPRRGDRRRAVGRGEPPSRCRHHARSARRRARERDRRR